MGKSFARPPSRPRAPRQVSKTSWEVQRSVLLDDSKRVLYLEVVAISVINRSFVVKK